MVKRIFQRTAHSILQKGAFTERYNRQSKTIIQANTRVWESCSHVTPHFTQIRQIGKLENKPLNMFAVDTSSHVDSNTSYQIAAR